MGPCDDRPATRRRRSARKQHHARYGYIFSPWGTRMIENANGRYLVWQVVIIKRLGADQFARFSGGQRIGRVIKLRPRKRSRRVPLLSPGRPLAFSPFPISPPPTPPPTNPS